MAEQLVGAGVADQIVAAIGALEVLDPFQPVKAAARANRLAAETDFAGQALVKPGGDAAREPRPGGVVAVARPFGAAVDRLAVAERDREEEVGAFATVEVVGSAVVDQGVVAAQAVEIVGAGFDRRPVNQHVFAGAAG